MNGNEHKISHPRCKMSFSDIKNDEIGLSTHGICYEFITAANTKSQALSPQSQAITSMAPSSNDLSAIRDLKMDILILEKTMIQNEYLGSVLFKENEYCFSENKIQFIMRNFR